MPYENNNAYAAKLYEIWEKSGAFKPSDSKKKPYVIMLPLPNVTGELHIGHAFSFLAQDIEIRYHRMLGEPVLWLPGTDSAAIAVNMLVKRQLEAEGIDVKKLGREGFLKRVWEWIGKYQGRIQGQMRKLGFSLDWSRDVFTMDESYARSVQAAFIKLYEDGLIRKDTRLVNWDPVLLTTLSDLEVVSREEQGKFWHIRYEVEGGGSIVVATTRPETMLGDTAVAVAADDGRYKNLIGKFAIIPVVNRRIPIIADEHADKTKGTGAVKITPAHDFDDYEVGKRHNLPQIDIFDEQARINVDFVPELKGLDRFAAREKIVGMLGAAIVKVETITHSVPHAERGDTIVEPRLTTQWYCDVSKLAGQAIEKTRSGELKFFPKHWENTWYSWLENIEPWCISRQIWWGHRIPAYYDKTGKLAYVGFEPPAGLTQDEDTLDTWFSSALWPMATLGWPDTGAPDFKRFFPGSALVTGFDIIFFWVARMVMMSLHFTGKLPFTEVVMRGLVTDQHGVKMSKTKGNVLDPIALVDEYGIDAVRFSMCSLSTEGRFLPFGKNDVENSRRFLTKLLNAVAFWEAKGVAAAADKYESSPLADWILTRMNTAIAGAKKSLGAYRYDEYAMGVYHFVWDDFCDKFIEFAKKDMTPATLSAAKISLKNIILMLAPVVPFTCAELWERLGFGSAASIINASFAAEVAVKTPAAKAQKWLDDLLLKQKVEAEKAGAAAELSILAKRIASLEAQLANRTFVDNAKPEVVAERRQSLADAQARRKYLESL